MLRCSAWVVMLTLAVATPHAAHAQEATDDSGARTSSLSWVRMPGAEACLASRQLAEAVEARLRRDVFVSAADADLSIEGRVSRGPDGGFVTVILASDAQGEMLGERELAVEGDCEGLIEPLVLVVAVMIDPDAALGRDTGEPAEAPGPRPGPSPEERIVEVPVSRPWTLEIGGGIGGAVGLLPGVAPSLVGTLLVTPPGFWGVELESHLLATSEGTTDVGDASIGMLTVGLLLCPLRFRNGRMGARLCAGGQVGAIRVTDVTDNEDTERVVGQLLLRARLRLQIIPLLSLFARPTLQLPVRRDAFTYRDSIGIQHDLFAPSAVAATLDLGLSLHFDL